MSSRHRRRSGRRRVGWAHIVGVMLAVGAVVGLALVVRGFGDTGPDDVALPALRTPVTSAPVAPTPPSSTGSTSRSATTKYAVPGTRQTVTLGAAAGLVIDTRGQHRLTATVTSSAAVYEVGYLMPTSLDHPYGKVVHPGRRWSVTTTVSGRPNYAVIWVWAGKAGVPATCTISIDGTLRVRKTTVGAYGRQVCYA